MTEVDDTINSILNDWMKMIQLLWEYDSIWKWSIKLNISGIKIILWKKLHYKLNYAKIFIWTSYMNIIKRKEKMKF